LTDDTQICITTGDTAITVETEPKALFEGFITFVDHWGELGKIDATFDFSKLPPELHSIGLQLIRQSGIRMHMRDFVRSKDPRSVLLIPEGGRRELVAEESSTTEKPRSWWRRLFGRRNT